MDEIKKIHTFELSTLEDFWETTYRYGFRKGIEAAKSEQENDHLIKIRMENQIDKLISEKSIAMGGD